MEDIKLDELVVEPLAVTPSEQPAPIPGQPRREEAKGARNGSKKALEYRVYWLERKLAFQQSNRKRTENAAKIEDLPASPIKELMHLNNEFQRANEQARDLKVLSEAINEDGLKTNERSQRMQEVVLGKIADAERINRQSKRLQETTRKINNETVRTATVGRKINQEVQAAIQASQKLCDESGHLNRLSRAQHEATDILNRRTQDIGLQGTKVASEGLKLNNELNRSREKALGINQRSVALLGELVQTRAEFAVLNTESAALSQSAAERFEALEQVGETCQQATIDAEAATSASRTQFEQSGKMLVSTDKLNRQTQVNLEAFGQLQQDTRQLIDTTQEQTTAALENLQQDTRQLIDTTQAQTSVALTHLQRDAGQLIDTTEAQAAAAMAHLQSDTRQLIDTTEARTTQVLATVSQNQQQLDQDLRVQVTALTSTTEQQLADAIDATRALGTSLDQDARAALAGINAATEAKTEQCLGDFASRADQSLSQADNRIHLLTDQAANALAQSQAFLDETSELNQATRQLLDEGEIVNDQSLTLHRRCGAAIEEIDGALRELGQVSARLQQDASTLQQESASLNENSIVQQAAGDEINQQSLAIQRDSVRTQELSQEINSHSLSLHDESRRLRQAFEVLNQDNAGLVSSLTSLRLLLAEKINQADDRQQQLSGLQANSQEVNGQSAQLNAETRDLNDQTLQVLAEARTAIEQSAGLNQNALTLAQEIGDARQALQLAHTDSLQATQESRAATALVQQTLSANQNMHQVLLTSAQAVKDLQQQANEELQRLQVQSVEAVEITGQSKQAYERLLTCIDGAEQINDEFLRGLQVANQTHTDTEREARTLLAETARLHGEVRDIVALREGLDGFHASIDNCQSRLDAYATALTECEQNTSQHDELLVAFQGQLANYQTDTQRFRDAAGQFDQRARRLERSFLDYDQRLKDIEAQGSATVQSELRIQVEAMRAVEAEIRCELESGRAALDRTSQTVYANTRLELERFGHQLKVEANLDRQSEQAQNRLQQDEAFQLFDSFKEQIAEIKHRLGNYQSLLASQVDASSADDLLNRTRALEARLEEQQAQLDSQEAFRAMLNARHLEDNDSEQMADMADMVAEVNQALAQATATNRALQANMDESSSSNAKLLATNQRLESRLSQAIKDQARASSDYAQRLAALESRESEVGSTVKTLQQHDTEAQQTLQQMRLTMKESTRAMRDTNKVLESLQRQPEPAAAVKAPSAWRQSARQAVLSSVAALAVTSLAMFTVFGYQPVAAALASTLGNSPAVIAAADLSGSQTDLPASIAAALPAGLPAALQASAGGAVVPDVVSAYSDPSLDSLFRAKDSIARLGEFAWPLNSGIVDPASVHYQPHHQGISIQAELGDPVVAVNDGKVIYSANEIRGYGNVIVIEHDNNLLSVYANNQFNYVQQGDVVRRGQLIGDVGRLFDQNETGLYFEIRYKGAAQDPFNYLSNSLAAATSPLASR